MITIKTQANRMGTKRLVGHIDASGVVHEGAVLALVVPKRQNGFYDGWVAMAQNAFLALAKSGLGLEARLVLDVLMSRLDFENWIHTPQSEVAEILAMKKQNVNRAMKDLEKVEVILRGPKAGRSFTYRLNPNFGWKGSAKNHLKAIDSGLKERMKASNMSVVEGSPETAAN